MNIIGISGVGRVGKDTFFKAVCSASPNNKYLRMAFADELKEECDEFLRKNINISAFTEDPNEKALIRPFLVTYGSHIRRKLNKYCWVEKVENKISKIKDPSVTVFITDVRYENEMRWVSEKMGGRNIYLNRDGVTPANHEEKLNDPALRSLADVLIDMPNFKEDTLPYECSKYVCDHMEILMHD